MKDIYQPVENERHFKRDVRSNAIVNIDTNGLEAYKKRRRHKERLNNVEEGLQEIMSEVGEIRNLLKTIVDQR